uniref:Gnk2-homologous domain-containing protein n=1 Tax=Oryza glumipatula TaxID=40148 RepID=A0A0D9YFN6_9ORYZ
MTQRYSFELRHAIRLQRPGDLASSLLRHCHRTHLGVVQSIAHGAHQAFLPPRRRFPRRRDVDGHRSQVLPTERHGVSRENILVLPTDLPAQAAATRFASTQAGDGDDRALALSVCLGDSAPAQYRESLAAAVADVVAGCGAASRRAGAWLDGCYCYLAADTNTTTSPSGGEFHRWLVTGDVLPFSDNLYATFLDMSNGVAARMLATTATQAIDVGAATTTGLAGRVVAQCAAGVAPADCVQCLEGAAREMPICFREARREEQGEGVGIVVSDDCVLRFDMTSSPAPRTSNTCT